MQMDEAFERELLALAKQALDLRGFPPRQTRLISYRENAVFEILGADGSRQVLRLHRPGYMSLTALQSEISWLSTLAARGVPVPAPLPAASGALVTKVEGLGSSRFVTMLSWVGGSPLGHSGKPLTWTGAERLAIFRHVGGGMALLHVGSDEWSRPQDFQRHQWDGNGLLGDAPFWGRFWEGAQLSPADAASLQELRRLLLAAVESMGERDYGLIHADLVRENVLVNPGSVSFIDFDDAGFGWRLFDLATALLPNMEEPDYPDLRDAMIAGYRQRRLLPDADLRILPMFLVLRALTYVGWFLSRPEVDPSGQRLQRHVQRSLKLGQSWQDGAA